MRLMIYAALLGMTASGATAQSQTPGTMTTVEWNSTYIRSKQPGPEGAQQRERLRREISDAHNKVINRYSQINFGRGIKLLCVPKDFPYYSDEAIDYFSKRVRGARNTTILQIYETVMMENFMCK